MHSLIKNYENALQAIYDHVGFKEDWVVAPIDDKTDMYWELHSDSVKYAKTLKELHSQDGNYYSDEIYTQRFYSKWVYEGKDLTLIFCDPHVDGMKWFRLFDNTKRVKID
jgi:hypothetical protein